MNSISNTSIFRTILRANTSVVDSQAKSSSPQAKSDSSNKAIIGSANTLAMAPIFTGKVLNFDLNRPRIREYIKDSVKYVEKRVGGNLVEIKCLKQDSKATDYIIEYTNGVKNKFTQFRQDDNTLDSIVDYCNGVKSKLTAFRKDGKTVNTVTDYVDSMVNSVTSFREDGKTIDNILEYYINNEPKEQIFFKKDGKTVDNILEYFNGIENKQIFFKEDGLTVDRIEDL